VGDDCIDGSKHKYSTPTFSQFRVSFTLVVSYATFVLHNTVSAEITLKTEGRARSVAASSMLSIRKTVHMGDILFALSL
jgi:hypothetical protein